MNCLVKQKIAMTLIIILILSLACTAVYAHSGRTDSYGGHTNHSTGANAPQITTEISDNEFLPVMSKVAVGLFFAGATGYTISSRLKRKK